MLNKKSDKAKPSRLRTVNNILSVVVVGLSLYVMIFPLLPAVTYSLDKATNNKPLLVRANLPNTSSDTKEEVPQENTLVIPSMNLQKPVFGGTSLDTLSKGVWHRPRTGNPVTGGNMVLVGHRYGYNGDGVFYHLDKVKQGDKIAVYWQGIKYTYFVRQIKVVPATNIEIEAQTVEPKLTIYTCTPLWSFKDRLVVIAVKEGQQ